MNEYWFVPKRYGYGAAPVTSEGWLLCAIFVAIVGGFAVVYQRRKKANLSNRVPWLVFIASTVVFVWICAAKTNGEWAWRWGQAASQIELVTSV